MTEKKTQTYHVVHGTFRTKDAEIPTGGEVELTLEERKHMDPQGDKLATQETWKKMNQKKELERDIAASSASTEQEPSTKPGGAGTADDRDLRRTAIAGGTHAPPIPSLEEESANNARRVAQEQKAQADAAKGRK